jgi:AcrR family transcriptional regulator
MRKRAARNGNTRLKMIQTAFDLFHQQGVNATSVDEILARSGTGKSQFYHYFKNKEGIVHAVLQHFYERLKSNQSPIKNEIESWEDLEHWFQFFITAQKAMKCERSCPIGTIGNDLSDSQELLRQDVRLIFDLTRHSLARFFSGAKAKGEIPATVDPDALADFCFTIMQGGLLVAKIQRESAPFENAAAHAMAYLKSLKIS